MRENPLKVALELIPNGWEKARHGDIRSRAF